MKRLQRTKFARLLAIISGNDVDAVEFDTSTLQVSRGNEQDSVPLGRVSSAPRIRRGWFLDSLVIEIDGGSSFFLSGVRRPHASAFSIELEEAWIAFNVSAFKKDRDRIDRILAEVTALSEPVSYPAACLVSPILADAQALERDLLSKLQPAAVGTEALALISPIRKFVSEPGGARNEAAKRFVTRELERWKDFFDTIESKPLTPEQRLSVVVDEDATLVLAGAGSGKTSVITAKASYLVKSRLRKPEEILLLAFGKNAAAEMSERVESRSGVPIQARTFHKLAYDIIGEVEGSKPPLAAHATDDVLFTAGIKAILKDLVKLNPDVSRAIVRYFAHFLVEPKTEWDFDTKHAYYTHIEAQDLRTLQGEKVKSYEELQIANWLYENGVEYEYERPYEHKVSRPGRRDYCPDFYLTESGIYVEHFGVRRRILHNGSYELSTAPFVDREEYLAGIEWKRQIHAENTTVLVETYSYDRQEGRLLSALAERLGPHVAINPRPVEELFDRVVELKQVDAFSQLLATFLRKYKGGAYSLPDCRVKAEQLGLRDRADAFLDVFGPVYQEYQSRLKGLIDFEDMVLRAAAYVESGAYFSPFRHILVDEFQDISQGRARLVRALKAQHHDARVFAVGDDWQSIFQFAGSDIHVMRRFGQFFGGSFAGEADIHRTVDLGRTFRSVDKLAFAARKFVLRNPAQIEKEIVPAATTTEPALRLVSASWGKDFETLIGILTVIANKVLDGSASVLLLGRYRFLKPDIADLQSRFPRLILSFKTIHASKGLEADHVVLLKADRGHGGFPSEIVDDTLLGMVSPEPEKFEHAEERRLMYVAMTRARHTLTIIHSDKNRSCFMTELAGDPGYDVSTGTEDATVTTHFDCGACGGRMVDVKGQDGRKWFRCEHSRHCDTLLPACGSCGIGLPKPSKVYGGVVCSCGATYPTCPSCQGGWLIDRSGRYGPFLGCVRFPHCSGKRRSDSALRFPPNPSPSA